jgi:ribonuclease BN (tRNA processing enzyme)
VIGPPTLRERLEQATEALFPGAGAITRRHPLTFVECHAGRPLTHGELAIQAFEVNHPSGAPSHALRIAVGGRTLGFSGDTEWTESLRDCARGADLMIMECYGYETPVRYHMTWRTIRGQLDALGAGRVLLTHMNREMLANRHRVDDPRVLLAEDGLMLDV